MKFTKALLGLLLVPSLALAAESGGENNLFAGDIGNAVWTLAIFLVVVFVLGKFAWGPLLEGLQQREQFIRDSLEQAKSENDRAQQLAQEYEQRIAEAKAEATAIVDEGRRDARYELGIAFEQIPLQHDCPPWLIDRTLRHWPVQDGQRCT